MPTIKASNENGGFYTGYGSGGGSTSYMVAAGSSTGVSLGTGDNETRPMNKGVNYIIKY